MHGATGGDEHDAGVDDGDGQGAEEESDDAEGSGRRREQCR